jgi:hypothetical protein
MMDMANGQSNCWQNSMKGKIIFIVVGQNNANYQMLPDRTLTVDEATAADKANPNCSMINKHSSQTGIE